MQRRILEKRYYDDKKNQWRGNDDKLYCIIYSTFKSLKTLGDRALSVAGPNLWNGSVLCTVELLYSILKERIRKKKIVCPW